MTIDCILLFVSFNQLYTFPWQYPRQNMQNRLPLFKYSTMSFTWHIDAKAKAKRNAKGNAKGNAEGNAKAYAKRLFLIFCIYFSFFFFFFISIVFYSLHFSMYQSYNTFTI